MSQSIFSFSDALDRTVYHQHVAQQSRREKMRVQGFDPDSLPPMEMSVNMLSELFNFPNPGEWYRQADDDDDHLIQGLDADSAMQPQHMTCASPPPPSLHHQQLQVGVGVGEGQGLSLSLQPFQTAKAEEMMMMGVRDGVMLYLNNNNQQQVGMGYGAKSNWGVVNVLRNSRYSRAAQELVEELCSVGRGQFNRRGRGADSTPSAAKDQLPPLSPAQRIDHQRNKAKLLSILDEVDRRYNHYCQQMKMVVNSFDSIMGLGAATPYTSLAQKAMSRHFRCLKDAVSAQLKQTCDALGGDAGGSGITKGDTPRLRLLDQSLRQQRPFHQMGMMEQEAWRPQRGLPDRSVNILRAWLFDHFLHPYPSDADKHLLARQTGLSRNQVSNWFINARVRLWKPMVEDMYQQEAKEQAGEDHEQQITHSPKHQLQGEEANAPERFASNDSPLLPPPPPMIPSLHTPDLYASTAAAHIRLGATGDVSLTLGLRQAANAHEKSRLYI